MNSSFQKNFDAIKRLEKEKKYLENEISTLNAKTESEDDETKLRLLNDQIQESILALKEVERMLIMFRSKKESVEEFEY